MHEGRKQSSFSRTGLRLARCLIGAVLAAAFADFALAEGQTEVMKTMPSIPPPAVAPAPARPASPVGGSPSPWQTDLSQQQPHTQSGSAQVIADSDMDVIAKINGYFNGMSNLSGTFLQTDPDNKQKSGKFYLARPGKVRFDYGGAEPAEDHFGREYLAIEDHELNTSDRYPIDMTPFRLLLSETVDLVNDANIVSLDQGPTDVVIAVEDKKGGSGQDSPFLQQGGHEPEGMDHHRRSRTRHAIQVANLEQNKQLNAELFEFSKTIGDSKTKTDAVKQATEFATVKLIFPHF